MPGEPVNLLAQMGLESLGGWLTNPGLFLAGAAAVSLPIIIHLLNQRRFKIVDWAAMEFLLDADKKNRRRIRLENLILLLLRCLAVLLLAFLFARPFIPTSLTARLINAAQFERIILLDDSLSMQTRLGNESSFEIARKRLLELTQSLAAERVDNTLTVIRASRPEERLFNATHLGTDSVDEINAALDKLEAGDGVAHLDLALQQLDQYLSSQPGNVNRVVYILSDLRQRDWKVGETSAEAPLSVLRELSHKTQGCFLVDAGSPEDRNLTITAIRPEGALVAGVACRFDVSVLNQSGGEAQDIRVKFGAGEAIPLQQDIDRLAAGETKTVPFSFTFSTDDESDAALNKQAIQPRRVKVELSTGKQGEDDRLPADSTAYFPVRLVRGIPALIVDGDPSAAFGKSESFYLRRALTPRGPIPSGVSVDVISENEFEATNLDKYAVIFLCNVYRLGDKTSENVARLENWTKAGGGLVIMPGNQVDETVFNQHFYRDGEGLSPLRLERIEGDETESKWVNIKITDTNHKVFQPLADQNNPLLDNVKTFRWWTGSVKKEQLDGIVAVPARLSDVGDSPAVAEKALGQGRVLTTAIPADADWGNWSSDPSFVLMSQDLVKYMSGDRGDRGLLRVGEPLVQAIDLTQYELDGALTGPRDRQANLQAASPAARQKARKTGKSAKPSLLAENEKPAPPPAPPDQKPESGKQPSLIWEMEYDETDAQGFYQLKLKRRDEGDEYVLFAANVDPTEGDLKRVDETGLKRDLADSNVQLVSADRIASLSGSGSQTEIWWYLLGALMILLCGEQLLAWFFGLGRA